MLGILKLVILGTCLFGLAGSANAQDKAAAPVGSWRGSVVTVDLGSAAFRDHALLVVPAKAGIQGRQVRCGRLPARARGYAWQRQGRAALDPRFRGGDDTRVSMTRREDRFHFHPAARHRALVQPSRERRYNKIPAIFGTAAGKIPLPQRGRTRLVSNETES